MGSGVLDGTAQYEVLVGDNRETMRTLPDCCCQVCFTSPPYFGLRSYGVPPSVWGGQPDCEHEWGDVLLRPGGYLLMLCPHMMMDPSSQALTIAPGSTMRYRWPLMMNQRSGSHARLPNAKRNLRVTYKVLGWWIKEPADRDYSEVVDSFENDPPKKKFNWEQSPSWARYCLGLQAPGSVVLDPMAGHGTLHVEAMRLGYFPVSCELVDERVEEIQRRVQALRDG